MGTTARELTAAERRQKAFDLRLLNQSYTTIGDALGCTKQAAWKMVQKVLQDIEAKTTETAATVKAMEQIRLDRMAAAALPKAVASNPDYAAIDRVLKIMERRAKLLGLDQPDKVAQTDPSGTQQAHHPDYDNALAELADIKRELQLLEQTAGTTPED